MTNEHDENTETARPTKPTIAQELAGLHATVDLQARQIAALLTRVRSLEHSRNPETWEDPEDWPTA